VNSETFRRESPLLREATLWLSARGFTWRNNTGVAHNPETGQHVRFGIKGGADLFDVVPPFGRFLGVETKARRGRQSDDQETFERAVRTAGGVYVLAKTLEDVERGYEEASTHPAIAQAIAAEREACAKIADAYARDPHADNPSAATGESIASDIRERSVAH